MLLSAADVEQKKGLILVEALRKFQGHDEEGLISLMALEKDGNGLLHRDFVAGADFSQSLVIPVRAGLAAANVVGGEQRSACSWEQGKKVLHALGSTDVYFTCHQGSMANYGRISSVCLKRKVRILAARWKTTGSRGFTFCPT